MQTQHDADPDHVKATKSTAVLYSKCQLTANYAFLMWQLTAKCGCADREAAPDLGLQDPVPGCAVPPEPTQGHLLRQRPGGARQHG